MLKVKNWNSFQSYKDRRPPWIRLHKSLLDNFEFQSMSANARALLPMLWLLASEDDDPVSGLIRDGYEKISFRLRTPKIDVEAAILECLQAGFLELGGFEIESQHQQVTDSSRDRYATVTPETETETETDLDRHLASPKRPPVPVKEIIDLYHELLPMCPSVQKITAARRSQIEARWRQGDIPDLDSWRKYFAYVAKNKFLTGQAQPQPGRRPFIADIDFLIRESAAVKIYEGKYS